MEAHRLLTLCPAAEEGGAVCLALELAIELGASVLLDIGQQKK